MSTERIVKFITEISYGQLPTKAANASKLSILDCLGVALAGCQENASKIINEHVAENEGKPEAGVIGGGFKTSAPQAAWANGTKAHALDYDDYFLPYHPTVAILPAVLATAEKYCLSGKDVLLSYITGFEVEADISIVLGQQHYDRGWHSTSVLGSLGAAAAIAKMLKLSEEKTKMALGIASSLAGGLRKNFGTMTKPLHAGNAARNGVVAATLAQKGFTADDNILEGTLGFLKVLCDESDYSDRKISQKLGTDFYIVSPGVALKPYPSCAATHWAIDAALELKREAPIAISDIAEVRCRTSSGLPHVLIYSRPQTALGGKFSLEFCVSIALIDGEVHLKQFTDERVQDSAVQELMKKIKYAHPPEMGAALDDLRGEVVVKLRNGKSYSHQVDVAKGHQKNPLSWEEVSHKYRDCVSLSLSPEDTNKSLDLISNLESLRDMAELMDIFTFMSKQDK